MLCRTPREILAEVAKLTTLQHLAVCAHWHFKSEECKPKYFALLSELQQLTYLCLRNVEQLRDSGEQPQSSVDVNI